MACMKNIMLKKKKNAFLFNNVCKGIIDIPKPRQSKEP